MMGGITMLGSTFLNAQQTDYEQFRKETLDAIAYVRQAQAAQVGQQRTGAAQATPHA
jgi:hypothetical protein